MENDSDFAKDLVDVLGGEEAVQQVLSSRSSWLNDITQEMEGRGGKQIVKADDNSVVSGVKQSIKK